MKDWASRILLAGLVVCSITPAPAQNSYPDHAVKIIVPFGAGGITDLVARLIAEKMAVSMKQTVFVENRPGMGGALGPGTVSSAPPDGYTLLFGGTGNTIGQTLYNKRLPYNIVGDFAPISRVAEAVNVLAVNPKVPAKTVAELIALLKSKPDEMLYGSSGNGSLYHLTMELFKDLSGTKIRHIPYKTEGAMRTDVVAGRVNMMIDAYGVVKGNVDEGQLRIIATTSAKRFAALKDVPTLAESGLTDYEGDAWVGLLAPAGTPPGIIEKIHAIVVKTLAEPDVLEKFAQQGLIAIGDTPQEAGDVIKKDVQRWKEIIERAGVSIQ